MVLTQRDLIEQACRQAVGVLKFTNWRVDHRKLPLLVYTCTCYFSQRSFVYDVCVYFRNFSQTAVFGVSPSASIMITSVKSHHVEYTLSGIGWSIHSVQILNRYPGHSLIILFNGPLVLCFYFSSLSWMN